MLPNLYQAVLYNVYRQHAISPKVTSGVCLDTL
jgi:hypothetical protein